jgi:DNA-binding MarR family transcriptional regulator
MPPGHDTTVPAVGQPGRPAGIPAYLGRFLRNSNLFSAAVREVLGTTCLSEVSPAPVTPSQFRLIKVLARDGRHRLGDVARFLGISPPAATKCIDKLERLGLVVRSPSSADRRATLLAVSEAGRQLVQDCERLKARRVRGALRRLPPEEIDRLSRLLEQLTVSLFHQRQPRRGFCLRCGVYIDAGCPVARIRGDCPCDELKDAGEGREEAP